jgi:hypothetical protein
MATVHSLSGPPPAGGPGSRGPTYLVTTRELSADFAEVGSDQSSRDLGAIDGARFLHLLEKLVAIDALRLVDADPQLFVTVKSGRFLIQPQGGKLLVRPTNALDQIFFKLSPAEIPPFLDGVPFEQPTTAPATLISSATARVESATSAAAPISPPLPPPKKKSNRGLVFGALGTVVLIGGSVWFFFGRPPPPPPPKPTPIAKSKPAAPSVAVRPPDFDPITSVTDLANLQTRFTATYATSGDAGERMLELRADGTFRYQEFGASLAVTRHDNGPYTFAFRHGTKTAVLRAPPLDPIELRDDNTLFLRDAVFTRLPTAAK